MSALITTIVWHKNLTQGRTIAEALAMHFEGAEDEQSSAGLSIPTRVRCEGRDPSNPLSPPISIPIGEDIINIVILLFESDLIKAFGNEWSSFADELQAEMNSHANRILILPVKLGDRSSIPPFTEIQSLATALFPGTGPSDPHWMRRLILTIVAHLGNYLRRLEQFKDDPTTPIDEALLNRFPLFLSHAKRDGLAFANAIRDHLTNNDYGVETFIDAKDLPVGLGYKRMFSAAIKAGAVVAIRSDAYSSRPWCRWETLEGKRLLRPIVVLDLFRDAEIRMNAYGGNVPALRLIDPINKTEDAARDMDRAILAIMTETLRILVWNLRVESLKISAQEAHPERTIRALPRPPELVDIANLRREEKGAIAIVYPGPPLSQWEESLIGVVAGDYVLCTPSDLGVKL
jgi:hypothetical protein